MFVGLRLQSGAWVILLWVAKRREASGVYMSPIRSPVFRVEPGGRSWHAWHYISIYPLLFGFEGTQSLQIFLLMRSLDAGKRYGAAARIGRQYALGLLKAIYLWLGGVYVLLLRIENRRHSFLGEADVCRYRLMPDE